jgi:hypothetical protein
LSILFECSVGYISRLINNNKIKTNFHMDLVFS